MQVILDSDFVAQTFIDPPSIVGGGVLGYEALTLLTGQEGIGKSLLVMQLAYHIASGTSFLGLDVPLAQDVLLVQKELPDSELQFRFKTQLAGRPPTGRLHFVATAGDVRFMGGGFMPAELDRWVMDKRPRVLIVDPLVEFHSANENAANEMAAAVLSVVGRWKAIGSSVVLVHHHGKPSEESPRTGTNRIRGSSALAGSADSNLQLLEINRDKGWYQLEFAKLRRTAPQRPLSLLRDPTTLCYTPRGAHITIQAFLEEQGEVPMPVLMAWAESALKVSETTVERAVTRLVDEGRVRTYTPERPDGRGLANPGRPARHVVWIGGKV